MRPSRPISSAQRTRGRPSKAERLLGRSVTAYKKERELRRERKRERQGERRGESKRERGERVQEIGEEREERAG